MRDRLIELFYDNNVHCDQKIEELADDVMDTITESVTVQEWISVKDRLPEKWQNVLAVRSDGKIRFDFICSTGCWCEDVNYVGYSVTHWMPLPQPPKGE